MASPKKWITSQEAAVILTANSGHTVTDAYARRLGNTGKLTTQAIDKRTKLFLRTDVEKYIVKERGTGEVRRAARARKTEQTIQEDINSAA
jgi:hypothetical protein